MKSKLNITSILYTYTCSWIYNLSIPVNWHFTRSCFALAVYDVFTLNPLDVGCVRIDSLVLDAWFFLLVVSGFELAVR